MHNGPSSSEKENAAFSAALSKLASVSRAEMHMRVATAPKEAVSRHKRYKYVPEEKPSKR